MLPSRREQLLLDAARLEKSDWPRASRVLLRGAAEALDVHRVGFWRFDRDGKELVCEESWLAREARFCSGERLGCDAYPAYFKAIRGRRVIAATDASNDPRMRELAAAYLEPLGIRALMDVPVWSEGRVVGIVCHEHVGGPREWSDADQQFGVAVAELVSLCLASAARREAEKAREEAVAALEADRRLLRDVVDQLPAAVLLVDTRGLVVLANAGVQLFGEHRLTPGASLYDLFQRYEIRREGTGPIGPEDASLTKTLATGEAILGIESEVRSPDGTVRTILSSTVPVRADGQMTGALVIAMDVTAQKQAERQLAREAALRETFIGVLAHDLRNPISAVMLRGQLLLASDGFVDRTWREHAQAIVGASRRMLRLVADLLAFAKSRAAGDRLPVSRADCDLAEAARIAIADAGSAYRDARFELHTEGDLHGRWDLDRLVQAITNLLTNAAAHGAGGKPVDVRLDGRGDEVLVHVHNEGNAIPPERVPGMFDAFRTNGPEGETVRHAGLGLYVVKSVCESHGGRVDVQSHPGDGTTFTLRLPRG